MSDQPTDQPTDPPAVPQLQYEDQPIIGNVVRQRSEGGVVTIQVRRSPARLVQAMIFGTAGLVMLGCGLAAALSRAVGMVGFWIFFIAGGLIITASGNVVAALHPLVLTLDPRKMNVRWRGFLEIHNHSFERMLIADVRVERLPFKDTLLRPHALVIMLHHGQKLTLLVASRAEVRYVAGVLREELHLPPERWPEMGYPPRAWGSRISRTIEPLGLTLRVRPTLVPLWFLPLTPLIATAAAACAQVALGHELGSFLSMRWNHWLGLWAGIYFLLMSLALLGMVWKLRTRYTLTINPAAVRLRETGLHPGEESWPIRDVQDIRPTANGRGLELPRHDGVTASLFPSVSRRDISWVCASARRAAGLSGVTPPQT